MATYNWTDKAGMLNRYPNQREILYYPNNIFLPAATTSFAFTSVSGNDILGDGSAKYPWKSISGTPNIPDGAVFCILSSGVYRGMVNNPSHFMYFADGDVVIDNSIIGQDNLSTKLYGLKFINTYNHLNLYECRFCTLEINSGTIIDSVFGNNIISASSTIYLNILGNRITSTTGHNTFINCSELRVNSYPNSIWNSGYFSIFFNCHINFTSNEIPDVDFSLFHNCTFSLDSSDPISINSLEDFLSWAQYVNPKINRAGWKHCIFANPKFNNPEIGDYSLAFDSPAKNLSYFGTYVGAQGVGHALKARANENDGDFDFDTAINVSVEDDSIRFIDDAQLASIETKVKPNLVGRELGRAPIYGSQADRNGQYIDSIGDLAATTLSAGTLLTANTPYLVEAASVVYNGSVLLAGERFTTGTELSFSSAGGGVVREITEAPQKHTLMARFSDGGSTITAGTGLVAGYWYHASGSINYNGVDYVDEVFKAVDGNSFSGPGTVREAMTNQSYQHYEHGIKFTSNNFGDTRTGEIIRGNGDPDYERGVGKEFPINSRFIQIKYVMSPNNLRP